MEFEKAEIKRTEIDSKLKKLNKKKLKSKRAAKVNFPLLDDHPVNGTLRTNARLTETYDQIAIFAHDKRLPTYKANKNAGMSGSNGYDYGVSSFMDLFAQALHDKSFDALSDSQKKAIIKKTEHDVSDHMPAWIRLPIPGA